MNTYQIWPQIAHETVDNEAVIVNLDTGFYYSLRDVAADVWDWLSDGATEEQVVAAVSYRYGVDSAEISDVIRQFIGMLVDEKLIVSAERPSFQTPNGTAAQKQFTVPIIERYDDMAQLLLLDPIHDVDDTGWPHQAA